MIVQAGKANFNYGAVDQDPGLDVAAEIWDNTTSVPGTLAATVPMTHTSGGVYVGQYVFVKNKTYTIVKRVYTDGTYTTPAPGFSPDEDDVQCVDLFQQSIKNVAADIDMTLEQFDLDSDLQEIAVDMDIPGFQLDVEIPIKT